MSAITASQRLSYEARVRPRQAIVAGAAGILLIVSAVLQLSGPHAKVAELTLGLLTEHRRLTLDLISAVIQAIGWGAVGWTLIFLLGTVRARESQVPTYIRYIAFSGAPLVAVGIIGYFAAYGVQANHFVTHGSQTYPEANHLMSAPLLAAFQVMNYAGELLLAVAFVLISLQAMRVGLLTRFMGYLGIIAGVLVLIPVIATPVPIVQAYWLVALGVLFAGRWPTGMPPSWQTGKVERWPSSQEMREQRTRSANGRQRTQPAPRTPSPQPTGTAAGARGAGAATARGPRSATPKRKRKRRK
jgi:hypothetical protein